MNLLLELTKSDIIITAIMAYLGISLYLASGIMLMVKKDQTNVSKKHRFANPQKVVFTLGLVEVIGAGTALVTFTIGLIMQNLYITMAIVSAAILLTSVIAGVVIQRKNRL